MKVGIITYHAAYNFGSVLQAYATQCAVEKLGFEPEIINYRMEEQKKFYELYRTKYGKLNFLQDIAEFPLHGKRLARATNYEEFFRNYLKMTEEFSEPEQMQEIAKNYDIIISGSDQLFNKHSCEFTCNDWKYMDPFLLKGLECKKISYASSIGHTTDEELVHILPSLQQFDYLSMREKRNADKIAKRTERDVAAVLDPTFLLTREEWTEKLELKRKREEEYILYYSLRRFDGNDQLRGIMKLADELGLKLKYVTPFSFLPTGNRSAENHISYGPRGFLNALSGAALVISESYHGTILSANFEKPFISICNTMGGEYRKIDLLKQLQLEDRIAYDLADVYDAARRVCDFSKMREPLERARSASYEYLETALQGCL